MARQIKSAISEEDMSERLGKMREMTTALLNEIKALTPLKTIEIKNGIDLEREVKEFEIYLIERALEQTDGSQLRAAKLLNVNPTTLNAKIKRFQISPGRQTPEKGNSSSSNAR